MGRSQDIHPDADPKPAKPVRVLDPYKDILSDNYTVSTSVSFSDMSITISEDYAGVRVISDGTVRYNPVGAASADNSLIPTDFIIHGGKAVLDLVEFFAAAGTEVGFIFFTPNT